MKLRLVIIKTYAVIRKKIKYLVVNVRTKQNENTSVIAKATFVKKT